MNKYFFYLCLFIVSFYSAIASSSDDIVVGTIERPPFSFHDDKGKLTGFSVELWEEIARKSAIPFVWKEEKQFSSLIDDVVMGETSLAVANISITSEREKSADFSHTIFKSGMAIAVKKGATASYFNLIWESGIILFLLGAFVILLIIAHLVWFFERNVEDSRHDYFRDDYFGGVWDAFWWAFVIMTMGGFENEVPHKYISRFLAIFWTLVSLFFISTLTAKITTALTVAELQTGIETYQDLVGKKVGVTARSSHEAYLNKVGISTKPYPSLTALYSDLENEKIDAIVADLPILSYHASHRGANWMQVAGLTFNHEDYGILFPENSPHLEKVNGALLLLREEGVYSELYEKYFGQE